MSKWIALALLVGCGQMYQKPGGDPQQEPQVATAPTTAPTSAPAASGPPGGGDPYAANAYPAPAPAPPAPEAPTEMAPKLSGAAAVFVAEHNRYRKQHCAQPLSWSPQLAADAQAWADQLKQKGCMFGHSGSKHGENLAAGTTGAVPPAEVVRMWYDEVKLYDFKKPTGFSMETGHFTQVVWLDTTQVGCGMVQCKGNDIWVCQYEKPGNFEGQFKQKVLPQSCAK